MNEFAARRGGGGRGSWAGGGVSCSKTPAGMPAAMPEVPRAQATGPERHSRTVRGRGAAAHGPACTPHAVLHCAHALSRSSKRPSHCAVLCTHLEQGQQALLGRERGVARALEGAAAGEHEVEQNASGPNVSLLRWGGGVARRRAGGVWPGAACAVCYVPCAWAAADQAGGRQARRRRPWCVCTPPHQPPPLPTLA